MPKTNHNRAQKKTVLQLKNVSKTYQVGEQLIHALNNVSFAVAEGEFVAVMGPSGSGKSTFLQVASILADASSGQIWLKDKEISKYNEAQRAHLRNREIGFIFQQFNLLKKTSALDNVALPLIYAGVTESDRQQRARAMLAKFGLADRINNTPAQLSGGQQQRVAIARALINNPSIVFADEPTGNLDSKSGADVEKILKELHQEGKTIIMVTHDSEVAKIAKRQICIKDGQIVNDSAKLNKGCQQTRIKIKRLKQI